MNRIKEAREARGISQRKLAAVLGLSPGSVCRYESPDDKNGPSTEMWIKMAEYFHVPVDYLMGLDNEKAATPEGSGLDEGARYLLKRYNDAKTDEERKRIITAVEIAVNLDKSTKDE